MKTAQDLKLVADNGDGVKVAISEKEVVSGKALRTDFKDLMRKV